MTIAIRDVGSDILMVTAPNPGPKTLQGTNCYVVGDRNKVLIDVGPDLPSFLSDLAETIGGEVTAILLTHGHPDHASGAPYLSHRLGVPVWASPRIDPSLRSRIGSLNNLEDGHMFDLGSATLRTVAAPGHSADHVCFFLEPGRVLFSGDNILGSGTSLIALPEGDMVTYLNTLTMLRALRANLIAPGHGEPVTEVENKIDYYIEHRRQREARLLAALSEPRTVDELVKTVYGDIDRETYDLARLSVEAQLAKLETEDKVTRSGEHYRTRAES